MSLYIECKRIKEERRKGLLENFENICKSILKEFDEESTLRCIRLENFPEEYRITISDIDDEQYILNGFEYGDEKYLDYIEGVYDLKSEEGYNEFKCDFMYYMYMNTDFVFTEENNSIVIKL